MEAGLEIEEDRAELLAETTFDVQLYVYDLSRELTDHFRKILKGKPLPCVWHTGLVAYGREYYFGSSGIESCRPGETILGAPDQIVPLGQTELPYSLFLEYVFGLGETTYKPGSYHLLEHNSNCFSGEVCQFLTGGPIPSEIRDVPKEISANKTLSSALTEYFHKLSLKAEGSKGLSFGPVVSEEHRNGHANVEVNGVKPNGGSGRRKKSQQINPPEGQDGDKKAEQSNGATRKKRSSVAMPAGESSPVNGATPQEAPKPAPQPTENNNNNNSPEEQPQQSAQAAAATDRTAAAVEDGLRAEDGDALPAYTPRRSRRYEDPAITFPEVDGPSLLRSLMEKMDAKLSPEEKRDLNDVMEYITTEGGAWALGTSHLNTFDHLMEYKEDPSIPALSLKVLRAVCRKDDAILLLHQDRQSHSLMRHFRRIEQLSEDLQMDTALLLCELSANPSCLDWLTYISEWEDENGRPASNSRCTTVAAVHSLLSPSTKEVGCALVYNLALKKELFEDMATEISMAVLQFLQTPPEEPLLYQSLTSLLRFMCISYNEIPALVQMLGPDVESFRGASPRVDERVEEIQMKLRTAPLPH